MDKNKTHRWTVDVSRNNCKEEWNISVALAVSPETVETVKAVDNRPISDISAAIGESVLEALKRLPSGFVEKFF